MKERPLFTEKENVKALGLRLDDQVTTKSYEVVKILHRHRVDKLNKDGIKDAVKRCLKYYSQEKGYGSQQWFDFHKSKLNPNKIKKAMDYVSSLPDDIEFKRHNKRQTYWDSDIWTNNDWNLSIVDFETAYYSDSWSTYAIIINKIPTFKVGAALYQIKIDNEVLKFRSKTEKKIWSFRDVYWGQVYLYSTANGIDKVPLMIEISNSNDDYEENGFYLVVPKSFL